MLVCESECECAFVHMCTSGRVQVVMKHILQCDIFNNTKFLSSSSAHGSNLNSNGNQCACVRMAVCVCVHTLACVCLCARVRACVCGNWCSATSNYSSYSCHPLFLSLIFCLQNNTHTHTHTPNNCICLYQSLHFLHHSLCSVSFVQYFMLLRAYLF